MAKSKKPKRRVLTAREKLMREKYTRLVKWFPRCHAVTLVVGVHSFNLMGKFTSKAEAEWMRDMLAIALSGIET